VATAVNGKEALALLESASWGEFELVLMDIQMPEMDGFQATAAIRQKERETGKHIPIIAMTAHALKGDRERCLAGGMDGYLAKPIEPKELFNAIEALVPITTGMAGNQPTPPQPAMVLDEAALLARVEGEHQLLAELVTQFLKEYPRMLEQIREALDRQDARAVERAAHTLKGSVGNFGAKGTFEAALEMERIACSEDLAGAELAFQHLKNEMALLELLLARLGEVVVA
jgi:two-component system sensor histidine kinase/response regulator